MGKRAASLADLRRAARLAAETGLAVTVEAPDGTVYRIAPDDKSNTPDPDLIDWSRK